ncbi:MAG: chorismate mutase [Alphaproteobacteria bacterium]
MTNPSLEDLRQAIDTIDDTIHELLLRRVDVVAPMATLKAREPGRDFMRPAREADILRRLIARHTGPLPVDVMVGIWREVISAILRLQGAFSVHVFATLDPDHGPDLAIWDLARAYFGIATPMTVQASTQKLIRAVAETPGALGVVPPAAGSDSEPAWWQGLLSEDHARPHIIARIPFITGEGVAVAFPPAYVLGCVEPAETGDDTTVIALIAEPSVSRARILAGLEAGQSPVRVLATRDEAGPSPLRHYLCEIDGFHYGADEALAGRIQVPGIVQAAALGAYARPAEIKKAP